MAKVTIKGLQAQLDELSIKLKASIARENALRTKLEKAVHPQAFSAAMNMTNPLFREAYDKLRAARPEGIISKQEVIHALHH